MHNPNEYSTFNELTDLLKAQGLCLSEAEAKYPLATQYMLMPNMIMPNMLMPTASSITIPVLEEMQRIKHNYGFIPSFHVLFNIPKSIDFSTHGGQAFIFMIHKDTPADIFKLACQVTDNEDLLNAVATHILCQ